MLFVISLFADEISRRDAERVYSSYERDYISRDYVSSRSDVQFMLCYCIYLS